MHALMHTFNHALTHVFDQLLCMEIVYFPRIQFLSHHCARLCRFSVCTYRFHDRFSFCCLVALCQGLYPGPAPCHMCTQHWLSHGRPTYVTLGLFFINASRHTLFLSFPALSVWCSCILRASVPLKPLCEVSKPSRTLFTPSGLPQSWNNSS